MWRGQVVDVRPNSELIFARKPTGWVTVNDYVLAFDDVETDQTIGKPLELPSGHHRPVVLDDRLFLIAGSRGIAPTVSHEFVDGQLKPVEFLWADYDPLTMIEGRLFRIQGPPATPQIAVCTVEAGKWTQPQEIVLPTFDTSASTGNGLTVADFSSICEKGLIHAFAFHEGKLFYKRGITLRSDKDPNKTTTYGQGESESTDAGKSDHGWNQVLDSSKAARVVDQAYGALVDGVPVALVVSDVESHRPTGSLYRFDGTNWNEQATIAFPFGSNRFRLFSPGEKLAPYVVATSSAGTGFAYRWDSSGISEVPGQGPELTWSFVKRDLFRLVQQFGMILVLGLLPCVALWLMTDLFTRADYSFGLQSARLAPVGYRAIAKLIDLSLIVATSGLIAFFMIRTVNWFEVAESVNLQIDHPDLERLYQAANATVISIALMSLLLVLIQGIWSITPGKWLCGLKTVRTTLRPCGIAGSLAREFLFVFDSAYLLWWIPGLLTMGLTSHRQRLGDLLGGTIVINSRSLKTVVREPQEISP